MIWSRQRQTLFDPLGLAAGMRLIVRRNAAPGSKLRITDVEDMRITAFVTNATRGQLVDLELRHRRRARAEDRTRAAKDTGLATLPQHILQPAGSSPAELGTPGRPARGCGRPP